MKWITYLSKSSNEGVRMNNHNEEFEKKIEKQNERIGEAVISIAISVVTTITMYVLLCKAWPL